MSHASSTPSQQSLLQQAPVRPLDASGFTASVVGTILFLTATIVSVSVVGSGEWTYILGTGTGIGIILIPYTAWHKYWRNKKDAAQGTSSVED